MNDLFYNYVYFSKGLGPNDELSLMYNKDILNCSNIKVKPTLIPRNKRIFYFLYKIHFSSKINNFIKLPFKNLWNKMYFKNEFTNDKPICFIFEKAFDLTLKHTNFYDYLKRHYKGCKLVFLFKDRVEGTSAPYSLNDIRRLREYFDDIYAYNLFDVEKYRLSYYPLFESYIYKDSFNCDGGDDMFFAGEAKGRTRLLYDICNKANHNGISSCFFIHDITEKQQLLCEGMEYSKKWMSFDTLLTKASKAKCLVEIIQPNAWGFTDRFWHSIFYNKYLISNNPIIKFTKFYNTDYMQLITTADEIDFEKIKNVKMPNYSYNNEFSPMSFIKYIDQRLINHIEPEDYYKDWFDLVGYKKYLELSK